MEHIVIIVFTVFVFAAISIYIIRLIKKGTRSHREYDPDKRNKYSYPQFEIEVKRLQAYSTDEDLDILMNYLKGYLDYRHQRFSGKEYGLLKGTFFHSVIPSSKMSIHKKEEYRKFLIQSGMTGVDQRPEYETRDGRLSSRGITEEAKRIKRVGNEGEREVRAVLDQLDKEQFRVISGVVIEYEAIRKEFDHIVICPNGIFILETKAFGRSEDNKNNKASLFIDPGDKWILRKYGQNRELKSPTEQIHEEKQLLDRLLESYGIASIPMVVLSNSELFVKKNIELDYGVIRVDALIAQLYRPSDHIGENDMLAIIQEINAYRIN